MKSMRTSIILASAALLTGCSAGLSDEYVRSDVVAVCHDGTWVVRNRDDHRLRVVKVGYGGYSNGTLTSEVDKNVKLEDICR